MLFKVSNGIPDILDHAEFEALRSFKYFDANINAVTNISNIPIDLAILKLLLFIDCFPQSKYKSPVATTEYEILDW